MILNKGGGYTGTTTVSGGVLALPGANSVLTSTAVYSVGQNASLQLDDTGLATSVNHIPTTAPISLSGGTLRFVGSAVAGVSEAVGSVTLAAGHSTIQTIAPSPGLLAKLSAASLGRSKGATVNFSTTGNTLGTANDQITVGSFLAPLASAVAVNGGTILPYATVSDTDVATSGASGVAAFSSYVLNPVNLATVPANSVIKLSGVSPILATGNANLAGLVMVNSALTVNLGLTVNLADGTLLLNNSSIAPPTGSGVSTLAFGAAEGYVFTNAATGTSTLNQIQITGTGGVDFSGPSGTVPIASISESGNTVTVTTGAPLGLKAGESVSIVGLGVTAYNGTFAVGSVLSPTSFTYSDAVTGLDPTSGGTATPVGLSIVPIAAGSSYTGASYLNTTNLSVQGTAPLGAGAVNLFGGQLTSPTLNYNRLGNLINFAGSQTILNAPGLVLPGAVTLVGTDALTFNQPTTFTGNITGSGSLVVEGTSTVTLSPAGRNSYSGGTVLVSGTLLLGSTNTPLGSGSVTLAGNAATASTLKTNAVAGIVLGNPLILSNAGSLAGGANVTIGAGGPITFGNTVSLTGMTNLQVNAPLTFSGVVSGTGGLIQSGSSTLTFSLLLGSNTFTGATVVAAGDVAVNTSQGSSPVGVIGGILSGTGTVGPITVGPGGTVEPGVPGSAGTSVGTLTAPAANFTEGGNLDIQITTNAATGKIASGILNLPAGTALIGGGTNLSTVTVDLGGLTAQGEALGVLQFATALGIPQNRFQRLRVVDNPNDFAAYLAYGSTGLNVVLTSSQTSASIVSATTYVWTGLGNGDPDWSNPLNWLPHNGVFKAPDPANESDDLIFTAGAAELNTRNDYNVTVFDAYTGVPVPNPFKSITVDGGGYTFAGNTVTLEDFLVTDEPAAPPGQPMPTTTVTFPMILDPQAQQLQKFPFPPVTFTCQYAGTSLIITSADQATAIDMGGSLQGYNLTIRGDGNTTITDQIIDNSFGGGSLTKIGTGTLFLEPNPNGPGNSYPGGTTLGAGVTVVNRSTSLGDPAGLGVTVDNGATLQLTPGTVLPQSATLNGYGVTGPNGLPLGALDVTGGATLSGTVFVDTQAIGFGEINNAAGGTLTLGNVNLGNSTLVLNNSGTINIPASVQDAGNKTSALVVEGSSGSTVNLTGDNTFTGSVVVMGGTVKLTGGGTLDKASNIQVGSNNNYTGANIYPFSGAPAAIGTFVIDDTAWPAGPAPQPPRLLANPDLTLDGGAFVFKGPLNNVAAETVGNINVDKGQSFISMQTTVQKKAALSLTASSIKQTGRGAVVDFSWAGVALTPTSTNQVQFDNQPPLDKANIINFATVSQVPPLGDQPVADFATATLNGGTKTYVLQSNNTATGLPANGGGPNAVAVITANTTITGAGVEVDALIVRAGATVTIGPSSPLFIDNALLLTPDNTTNYGGTSPTIGLPGAVLFGFRNSPNNAANVISFAPTGQPAVINAQLQGTGGIFFAGTSTTEIQSQAPSVGNQQYTGVATIESGTVVLQQAINPLGTGDLNLYGGTLAVDTSNVTGIGTNSLTLPNALAMTGSTMNFVGLPMAGNQSAPLNLTFTGQLNLTNQQLANGSSRVAQVNTVAIPQNVNLTFSGPAVDGSGQGGLMMVPGGVAAESGTLALTNTGSNFSGGLYVGNPYDTYSGTPASSSAITAASESGATVTITMANAIPLVPGQAVTIAGVTPAGYNGTYNVTSVNGNTFTYTDTVGLGVGAVAGATVVDVPWPTLITDDAGSLGSAQATAVPVTLFGSTLEADGSSPITIPNTLALSGAELTLGSLLPSNSGAITFSGKNGAAMSLSGVSTLLPLVPVVVSGTIQNTPVSGFGKNVTTGSLNVLGSITLSGNDTENGAFADTGGTLIFNGTAVNSPVDVTDTELQGNAPIVPGSPPALGSLDYIAAGSGGVVEPGSAGSVGVLASTTTHNVDLGILSGGANFGNNGTLYMQVNATPNENGSPGSIPPITSVSEVGSTVTVTTAIPNGFVTGQSVMIIGVLPVAYDGTFTVTVVDPFTFTYANPANPNLGPATLAGAIADGGTSSGVGWDQLNLGTNLLVVGGSSRLVLDLSGLNVNFANNQPVTVPELIVFGGRSGNVPLFSEVDIINNPHNYAVELDYVPDPASGENALNLVIGTASTDLPAVTLTTGSVTTPEDYPLTFPADGALGAYLTATYGAGAAQKSGSFTVSDPTAVNPLTVTVSVSNGTLTLGSNLSPTIANIVGNGTGSISFSDVQGNVSQDLSGLVYQPPADFSGSATLTLNVTNVGGGTLLGPPQTTTLTVPITVTANLNTPIFTPGPNVTGTPGQPSTFVGWATKIFGQPPTYPTNNTAGSLAFTITTDFPSLFSVQPALSFPAGVSNPTTADLSFTVAPGVAGTAHLTITLSTLTPDSAGQLHSYTYSTLPLPTITIGNPAPTSISNVAVRWGKVSGSLSSILAGNRPDVPFAGINAIDLTFNKPVNFGGVNPLTVSGLFGNYAVSSPVLVGNNTYEWKLSTALGSAKGYDNVTLRLGGAFSGVAIPNSNFHVLVGDVNGDRKVDLLDQLAIVQALTVRYNGINFLDIDGSGTVDMGDYGIVHKYLGNVWH